MSKYIWLSDSPTIGSGYGTQTAIFTPRIKASGRDVVIFARSHTGSPTTWDNILVLPRLLHQYGNDIVTEHFRQVKASILVTLVDSHVLDGEQLKAVPWCAWAPLDCEPIYPGALNALRNARWIWAMSRFGHEQLKAADLGEKTMYVPHGIDTHIFKPADRDAARVAVEKATGANLANKFVVALVGANQWAPSRKGFFEAFSAFKIFVTRHPDTFLYVHSQMYSNFGGEDLPGIMELVNLDPKRVLYAPQYALSTGCLSPAYMANMYNASDVFLSASHTEGFGLPSIEAQLCGCPVILPDNSAQTEMCLTGVRVDVSPYMSLGHVVWKRPNIPSLANALEWAYGNWHNKELRVQTHERARVYDATYVFEKYMRPALDRMEDELK